MTRILIPRSSAVSAKKVESTDWEEFHDFLNDYVVCGFGLSIVACALSVDVAAGKARIGGLFTQNTVTCTVTCLTACDTNYIYARINRDVCCRPQCWDFTTNTTGTTPTDSFLIGTAITDCNDVTSVCTANHQITSAITLPVKQVNFCSSCTATDYMFLQTTAASSSSGCCAESFEDCPTITEGVCCCAWDTTPVCFPCSHDGNICTNTSGGIFSSNCAGQGWIKADFLTTERRTFKLQWQSQNAAANTGRYSVEWSIDDCIWYNNSSYVTQTSCSTVCRTTCVINRYFRYIRIRLKKQAGTSTTAVRIREWDQGQGAHRNVSLCDCTFWRSNSSVNPTIDGEVGLPPIKYNNICVNAATDCIAHGFICPVTEAIQQKAVVNGIMIHPDTAATTATTLQIQSSDDRCTWSTFHEVKVASLTNTTDNFIQLPDTYTRYIRIRAKDSGSTVMRFKKLKIRLLSPYDLLFSHGHKQNFVV